MIEEIFSFFSSITTDTTQEESESLILLATFFYKVDNRISLEEQQYIERLMKEMVWSSNIDISTFQERTIAKINQVLGKGDENCYQFLEDVMSSIKTPEGRDRAKMIAKEISDADGEIADDEVRYLEFVLTY